MKQIFLQQQSRKGLVMLAKSFKNFASSLNIPRNRLTPLTSVGWTHILNG